MICIRQFKVSLIALIRWIQSLDGKQEIQELELTLKFGTKIDNKLVLRANVVLKEEFTDH